MVLGTGGMPTACSVTVVIGLPPGPGPGMVWGPPATRVWPQALRRKTSAPAVASAAAVAKLRGIVIAARRWSSGEFDLAATCGRSRDRANPATDLRHEDAGGSLASQLARLIDRLLECRLHAFGEFLQRLFQCLRLDLEPERQHARRGEQL